MVITKDQLQYIVDKMPAQIELDVLFDKILLIAKIEQGRLDIKEGRVYDWEGIKSELDRTDD